MPGKRLVAGRTENVRAAPGKPDNGNWLVAFGGTDDTNPRAIPSGGVFLNVVGEHNTRLVTADERKGSANRRLRHVP